MRPSNIIYRKRSKTLVLEFGPDQAELSAELLRVYSPSAEVRGHSPEQKRLQTGKKQVGRHRDRTRGQLRHTPVVRRWPRHRHLRLGLPQGPSRQPRPLLAGLPGGTESRQTLPGCPPFRSAISRRRRPDPHCPTVLGLSPYLRFSQTSRQASKWLMEYADGWSTRWGLRGARVEQNFVVVCNASYA